EDLVSIDLSSNSDEEKSEDEAQKMLKQMANKMAKKALKKMTKKLMVKASPTPRLFTNLSNDDEDDYTLICFMAKGRKVQSDDSSSSDSDDEHSAEQNMIKEFGLNGYNIIKKLMKKLEKRKMTLDKQEDLLILEKERNLALKKSLAKDKEKLEELTRELSLAKSTIEERDENLAKANSSMDNLKSANVELQESLSSLNVRF
ncbi:hypothetical protein BS78_02G159800, partial [Paspalum vaginatum]